MQEFSTENRKVSFKFEREKERKRETEKKQQNHPLFECGREWALCHFSLYNMAAFMVFFFVFLLLLQKSSEAEIKNGINKQQESNLCHMSNKCIFEPRTNIEI